MCRHSRVTPPTLCWIAIKGNSPDTDQTRNKERAVMSLELKWSNQNKRGSPTSNPARKGSLLMESSVAEHQDEDLDEGQQGFICFSWKSQFQRYIDNCRLASKFYDKLHYYSEFRTMSLPFHAGNESKVPFFVEHDASFCLAEYCCLAITGSP